MTTMTQQAAKDRVISLAQWKEDPAHASLYVWLHVDSEGDPFYAGRGRGLYAWEINCGPAWEWYVRNRLGGTYEVLIQAHSLSDEQSSQLLDQLLERHADKLLNRVNFYRRYDAGIQPEMGPSGYYYDFVRDATDPEARLATALEAQQLQYQSGGAIGETGRVGEVVAAMGAGRPNINNYFIPYIVKGFMTEGDVQAARSALAEFLRYAPNAIQSSKIVSLQRMVDRGTYKPRPRKAKDT